ncbi:hypothetical protein DRN52_03700 [Thermococci archaeon]|nr:MAG: hypothetical protein DRN52_03700 [Thermococci archaeon]
MPNSTFGELRILGLFTIHSACLKILKRKRDNGDLAIAKLFQISFKYTIFMVFHPFGCGW